MGALWRIALTPAFVLLLYAAAVMGSTVNVPDGGSAPGGGASAGVEEFGHISISNGAEATCSIPITASPAEQLCPAITWEIGDAVTANFAEASDNGVLHYTGSETSGALFSWSAPMYWGTGGSGDTMFCEMQECAEATEDCSVASGDWANVSNSLSRFYGPVDQEMVFPSNSGAVSAAITSDHKFRLACRTSAGGAGTWAPTPGTGFSVWFP